MLRHPGVEFEEFIESLVHGNLLTKFLNFVQRHRDIDVGDNGGGGDDGKKKKKLMMKKKKKSNSKA